jgi:hypothetical protein
MATGCTFADAFGEWTSLPETLDVFSIHGRWADHTRHTPFRGTKNQMVHIKNQMVQNQIIGV